MALATLAGCSRQPTSNCEPIERYSTARTAPPIQIPDDLTPPSEADALRLPPDVAPASAPSERCLESPPAFSPGSRRGVPAPAREAAPVEPTPPAPATPAAVDDERVIDN